MTDKNPYEKDDSEKSKPFNQVVPSQPVKERSIFSSILLVFWYIFLAAVGIALLGLAALFVVCMV